MKPLVNEEIKIDKRFLVSAGFIKVSFSIANSDLMNCNLINNFPIRLNTKSCRPKKKI